MTVDFAEMIFLLVAHFENKGNEWLTKNYRRLELGCFNIIHGIIDVRVSRLVSTGVEVLSQP